MVSATGSSAVLAWAPARDPAPGGLPLSLAEGLGVRIDGYLFDLPTGCSAEDHLAALWHRHGPAALDRLRGSFVAIVWDGRRLFIARDTSGTLSAFTAWDGRRLLFSTDLHALVAAAGAAPDPVAVAETLLEGRPSKPETTLHSGIHRLLPGQLLTADRHGITIRSTWDPLPAGFEWATQAESRQVVPLLQQAVDRCLRAGADSLALSGGFDSVSLAILAAGRRPPLHAISMLFPNPACDEGATQAAVARALGMPSLLQGVTDGPDCVAASVELSARLPSPVVNLWHSMFNALLGSARERGLRGLMMGIGGDEVFNVDLLHGADCLAGFDLPALWRFTRLWLRTAASDHALLARMILWDGSAKPVLRRMVSQTVRRIAPNAHPVLRDRWTGHRLPGWVAPEMRARLAVHGPEETAPWEGWYRASLRGLLASPLQVAEHDQLFAWTRDHGLRHFLPFFDRDLMELVLRLRPDDLMIGGRAKGPLRRLVAERLPHVPMRATKVNFTSMVHDLLRSSGRAAWRRLGGPVRLAGLGIADEASLSQAVESYFDGRHDYWRYAWLGLCTESWLRAWTSRKDEIHDVA